MTYFYRYNPALTREAKKHRKKPTKAEWIFWNLVKNKKLGYKFHREKPIHRFILDFYCSKLKLAVEIDGSSHIGKEKYDRQRTMILNCLGIKVIRFSNHQVIYDLENVEKKLLNFIKKNQ